jgi:hypothetical protein
MKLLGVADLRYESSFVGFLKPRPKLTFGWVQGCHSYLDSATPNVDQERLLGLFGRRNYQYRPRFPTETRRTSSFY